MLETNVFQTIDLYKVIYLADYGTYRPTFQPLLMMYTWVESKPFLVFAIHGSHSILVLGIKIRVCV